MHQIEFRPATLEDSKMLWVWRNDLETRICSLSSNEIPWDQHQAWLEKSLNDPNRKIYIATSFGKNVGTIRCDRSPDGTLELSWTIAPSERGKGLGSLILTKFSAMFQEKQVAKI